MDGLDDLSKPLVLSAQASSRPLLFTDPGLLIDHNRSEGRRLSAP